MRKRLQQWLGNLPIDDPLAWRQARLVQLVLLGLSGMFLVSAFLTLLAFPFTSGAIQAANLRNTINNSVAAILALLPLVLLRRGRFRAAIIIVMGELFLLAFTMLAQGLERGWIGALGFALPISLAALVLGRRWLLAMYLASVTGVGIVAVATYPISGLPQNSPSVIISFALVAGLLALFLDRFGAAFQESLAALRAREQSIRQIIETAQDAVITIDPAGMITGWNPKAEALFGRSYGEATGRPLMETIIPWHAHATYQRHLDPALAASTDVEFDQRFEATAQHRSGRTFPVELTVTVIRTGTSHRLSLFVRDITERRQAEAQLQIQLERHHLLNQITRAIGERQDLASIYQVVIRTLEDQMPLDFCCLLRYDPLTTAFSVTSIGLKSHDLATELMAPANHQIPRDASGLDRCVLGQVLDEPDLATTTAPWLRRLVRGGMRALVAAPLVVESHVFGVLVAARTAPHSFQPGMGDFLRQLSQHVALAAHQADLYRALQDAYDDLRQTQQAVIQQERLRALGQMASGIAHDINNAISPIGIYAELLLEQEPVTHSQARSWLETIVRATRDVAATIGRLKEFYVQRATTLDLVPVDLNRMVRQVVDLTRPRWSDMARQQEQTIDVRTDLAANVPLVLGVESEIREALTNLVFNAVDAMPQGGTVTLRTRVADTADKAPDAEPRRSVEVSVIDTGTGMDEATRQRCLEPFFTTKGEQGTGLGLAMVYGVARRHNASLEIESEIGSGTTMRMRFTALTGDQRERSSAASAAPILTRHHILVIDDDPLLLTSLRDMLEADGHGVVVAHGGQAGIDAFRAVSPHAEPFGVVITDLGMPTVNGRQVARTIKEVSPKTPVILLTGWGERLVTEGDIPPYVDIVLNKPPKLRELREALVQCVPSALRQP